MKEHPMKRSEINRIQREAKRFLKEHRFLLPPWAERRPKDWRGLGAEIDEIRENLLGWDVTDFGSGDFPRRGLFLFTLRNGNPRRDKKPYAEKIMIVDLMQETPMHFHRSKMEDIINRGGGTLIVELYASTDDEHLSEKAIELSVDGVRRRLDAGSKIALAPGESVCLEPFIYHRFWAEGAKTLVGEVSMANDDVGDNRFLETIGRFREIEEDDEPLHLLVGDYPHRLGTAR
jgi:D-lyxose ketol-isomerase